MLLLLLLLLLSVFIVAVVDVVAVVVVVCFYCCCCLFDKVYFRYWAIQRIKTGSPRNTRVDVVVCFLECGWRCCHHPLARIRGCYSPSSALMKIILQGPVFICSTMFNVNYSCGL